MSAVEAKPSEEIREALREIRGRVAIGKAAQTPQDARQHIEDYVILPGFYDASAASLAAEYMQAILKLEPTENVTLWALYTEAASAVLGRVDEIPIPCHNSRASA